VLFVLLVVFPVRLHWRGERVFRLVVLNQNCAILKFFREMRPVRERFRA
jgi:hypothetical protein